MKYFTDKEIEDAFVRIPQIIKNELSSGEDTATTIVEIGKKFNIHIDVIGMIAELNRNMLLGLIGPEEFLKELVAVGVSDTDAQEIMKEINQKIFMPLREQMRSGAGNMPQPPKPIVPPVAPQITIPPERNNIIPANPQMPRQQQVFASVPKYAPPPPRLADSASVATSAKGAAVSEGGPSPVNNPPASPSGLADALKQVLHEGSQTSLPTKSVNVGRLLEDHEEPHLNIGVSDKVQVVSKSTIEPPVSVPLKPSTLPLTPASGVIPPGVRFSPPPIVPKVETSAPKPPAPLKPSTLPLTPSSRPYSTDPYREPIDTQ